MKKIIQFFKESFAELKKVTWPTRDEVMASTRVLIIAVLIFAIVLGFVDFLLYQAFYFLFSRI